MNKKILFCFQSGNITNGAPLSLYLYLKYSRLNLRECIALFPFKGNNCDTFFAELEKIGIKKIKILKKGLDFIPVNEYLTNPLLLFRRLIILFFYSINFLRFIKKEKIDIVYVNGTRGNTEVFLGKLAGLKVIWHVRNLEELARFPSLVDKVPKYKIILKKIRVFINNFFADTIIVVANSEKKVLENLLKKCKPIYVIPNGIEESQIISWDFKSSSRDYSLNRQLKILSLMSTICPSKGSDIIIKVAEKLKEMKFNFIINVYGKKNDKIRECNYFWYNSQQLIEMGYLKINPFINNVTEVMLKNDILLFPTFFEGFPRTILEAMASQIFIITSAVDGILDQVINKESAILTPVGDVEAIVNGIMFFVNYPDLRESIIKNAWLRVQKKFLIKNIAPKIDDIIYQLLDNK